VLSKYNRLKLKYFQDTTTIFHGEDIRKKKNDFRILNKPAINNTFMADLTKLLKEIEFAVVATVIRKDALKSTYSVPDNPYYLATTFCLERLKLFLAENNDNKQTTVVFESRGKEEDKNLKLAFLKEAALPVYNSKFFIKIVSKQANTAGLQIADLVSRPIGRYVLDPEQKNRAFAVLQGKLHADTNGRFLGRGLKVFPV
jgi:hypothetical protein